MPVDGWHKDSVCTFTFEVQEPSRPYDMVVYVRHNDRYAYQNIWLFTTLSDSLSTLSVDTLDYYLANERGEWLGNGIGTYREMPCLIHHQVRFPAKGRYQLQVRQGMREEVLRGISDVGLTITEQAQ